MNNSEDVFIHRAPGCGIDFLDKLNQRAFDITAIIGSQADYSIDSIQHVDEFVMATRAKGDKISLETLCCLVAYCGEVIKRQINGDWSLEQYDDRWFPFIVRSDGDQIDFYGIVDAACFLEDVKYPLKGRIERLIKPLKFEVEKWTNWVFPTIKNE